MNEEARLARASSFMGEAFRGARSVPLQEGFPCGYLDRVG
jgi:hypothetical protein